MEIEKGLAEWQSPFLIVNCKNSKPTELTPNGPAVYGLLFIFN
jgi:hypothetical protein